MLLHAKMQVSGKYIAEKKRNEREESRNDTHDRTAHALVHKFIID